MGDEKRLINFVYSNDDAYAIELGHQYMRFFKDGAIITTATGTNPYVLYTDYDSTDVADIKHVQVVNTSYLVHSDYPPMELTRHSDNDWDFEEVAFYRGPFLDENEDEDITVSASATTGSVTLTSVGGNVWTALNVGGLFKIKGDKHVETTISGGGSAYTDPLLLDKDDKITLSVTGTWGGVVSLQKSYDGVLYTNYFQTESNDTFEAETEQDNVFWRAGITPGDLISGAAIVRITQRDAYGYGCITAYASPTSVTLTVIQDFPSTTATYKWSEGAFSNRRGFPKAVGFYKQRAFYGNTTYRPTTFWGSVIDDYSNFDLGTQADDDGLQFTIASNEVNGITSFVDQKVLLAFTERNIWKLSNVGQGITPTSVSVEKQTGFGASNVTPIIAGSTVLYNEAGAQKLRTLNYEFQYDSWVSNDISIRAEHLLKDGYVVDMCFAARPDNIIYMVMSTGDIVTCLYDPSNKLIALSKLTTTNGDFKSITTIPSSTKAMDEVWVIVKRVIDGVDKWYVERFTDPYWEEQDEYIYMDCSTTVTGTDITTVTGLDYLEGQDVDVVIDGAYYPYSTTVSGGSITIDADWSGNVVHVGLNFDAFVQTMRLNPPTEIGSSLGKQQAIFDTSIIVDNTTNCEIGTDEDTLVELPNFADQPIGSPPVPYTGIITVPFPYGYKNEQYIMLASRKPIPFTVLGITSTIHVSSR